jgi:hypothetical protein
MNGICESLAEQQKHERKIYFRIKNNPILANDKKILGQRLDALNS